jgi:hypothetical protein
VAALAGAILALRAVAAAAQPVDGGAEAADGRAASPVDGGAPATDVLPTPPGAPAPPPAFVPVRPEPLEPEPPPAAPAPSDGPGDEEAKADFQKSRPVPDGSPLRFAGRAGSVAVYGFAELDYLHDSTQSFGPAANNFTLARPQTPRGTNGPATVTLCDSRLGVRLGTAESWSVRGTFLAELGPSYAAGDGSGYFCDGRHVRHLYVAMRSPILDVLFGRYYGLFGWGGKGFFPNTAAFLGVPGQLYHLESQLRLSHIFRTGPVDVEVALAGAPSPQTESGTGEGHFGFRLAFNNWRGASAQGSGPPVAVPAQLAFSSVRRVLRLTPFSANPGDDLVAAQGDGRALQAFVPIFPARGDDLGNAMSATVEWTTGDGLADMYPGLTGGVSFPALPNPKGAFPSPGYRANLPQGIATFDANGTLHLVDWHSLVIGGQYHVPVARGRLIWVSAVWSRTISANAAPLTPLAGWGSVWDHAHYFDVNLFVAPTRALQLALSYQRTLQEFADRATARNVRGQLAVSYFF